LEDALALYLCTQCRNTNIYAFVSVSESLAHVISYILQFWMATIMGFRTFSERLERMNVNHC
jgi:hypothetical protein